MLRNTNQRSPTVAPSHSTNGSSKNSSPSARRLFHRRHNNTSSNVSNKKQTSAPPLSVMFVASVMLCGVISMIRFSTSFDHHTTLEWSSVNSQAMGSVPPNKQFGSQQQLTHGTLNSANYPSLSPVEDYSQPGLTETSRNVRQAKPITTDVDFGEGNSDEASPSDADEKYIRSLKNPNPDFDHSQITDDNSRQINTNKEASENSNNEPNKKISETTDGQESSTTRVGNRLETSSISTKPPKSNKAYVFFLGGIPSRPSDGSNLILPALGNTNDTKVPVDLYRGLLYNILVSVQILKDSGSTADFVLLVHMATPNAELPSQEVQWLQALGIRVLYVPGSTSAVNEFSTIALEKLHMLDLTEYKRVLYLDADVTPRCSLDYIMDLSMGDEPLLQENFLLSVDRVPASASMFMLAPGHGRLGKIFDTIIRSADSIGFRETPGWGKKLDENVVWNALSNNHDYRWKYEGADSDQGLIHHFTQRTMKKVSVAVGTNLEHWTGGKLTETVTGNPLLSHSCLDSNSESVENQSAIYSQKVQQHVSPQGVAPYRDFVQWRYGNQKPWNNPSAAVGHGIQNAADRWFYVMRQLDQRLQMGLGFEQGSTGWKHVPEKKQAIINPVWSTTVKSTVQWAKRHTANSKSLLPWQPPTLYDQISSNDDSSLRSKCGCLEPTATDPCTMTNRSLEDWLSLRTPMHLSSHRPLCPHAIRNHMHVLVPILNSEEEVSAKERMCSVVCQDYPPEKLSIYVYDNGPDMADETLKLVGRENMLEFTVKQNLDATALDEEAKVYVSDLVHSFKASRSTAPGSDGFIAWIHSPQKLKAGEAKFWALRFVEAQSHANDLVLVLDRQDELRNKDSLSRVNRKFIETKAWATADAKVENPRQSLSLSHFKSPVGLKAHLLQYLGARDFGITTSTDLEYSFVLRVLELAGVDRICQYSSALTKAEAVLPTTEDSLAQAMEPSERIELPIEVILSCFSPEILKEQVTWLQQQTLAKNRLINLRLLVSRKEIVTEIDQFISANLASTQAMGGASGSNLIKVALLDGQGSQEPLTPLLAIQSLRQHVPLDMVILLDGRQYWEPSFLESLVSKQEPRTATSWNGKRYSATAGLANFNEPSLSWKDIMKGQQKEQTTLKLIETRGSMLDADFGLLENQLNRIKQMSPAEGDMWLSYVLDALLGWKLQRLTDSIPLDISQSDKQILSRRLSKLPQVEKAKVISLRESADFQPDNSLTKLPDLFHKLQTLYHWNVFETGAPEKISSILSNLPIKQKAASPTLQGTKRAFVCVTGQFDRFEAMNKIENMFLPLQGAGYKTDVALILSNSGETSFTNHDLKDRKNIKTESEPFYMKFEDAVSDLEAKDVKVLFAQNGTYPKVKDPPFHSQYFKILSSNQGRSKEQQTNRVLNHARIFESYTRCLDYADAASAEATGRTLSAEEYYDVFIRIRDDVGFSRPLTPEVLTDLFPPPSNSVTVTECRGWQGINDRFAIVSSDAARTYFQRPYDVISNEKFVDGLVVRNPESFLLYVFATTHLHVLGHPELRDLNRFFKNAKGKAKVNGGDSRPQCPGPSNFQHLQRQKDLYGWFL